MIYLTPVVNISIAGNPLSLFSACFVVMFEDHLGCLVNLCCIVKGFLHDIVRESE